MPEKYPAALCVPVSSPTVPLGTLWLFSDREREFTATQTNMAEMTAGRLAAELERTMSISAQFEANETARQVDAAQRLQQSQLPQPIRLAEEGWDLAGQAMSAGQLGGAFYDWCWLPNDALAVTIGEAGQAGIAGALTASTLRSAVRTLTDDGIGPGLLLQRINRSLWLASGGDESASLMFAVIDLSTGRLRYSWAGQPTAHAALEPSPRNRRRRATAFGCDDRCPVRRGIARTRAGRVFGARHPAHGRGDRCGTERRSTSRLCGLAGRSAWPSFGERVVEGFVRIWHWHWCRQTRSSRRGDQAIEQMKLEFTL